MLTDQTFYAPPLFLVSESIFFDRQGCLQFPLVLGFRNAISLIEFRLAMVSFSGSSSRFEELKSHRLPCLFWRKCDPADFADHAFLRQTVQASDFVICPELPEAVVVPRSKQVERPWDFMVALQRLAVSPVPYSSAALCSLYE